MIIYLFLFKLLVLQVILRSCGDLKVPFNLHLWAEGAWFPRSGRGASTERLGSVRVCLSPSLYEGSSWRQEDPRASYEVGLVV